MKVYKVYLKRSKKVLDNIEDLDINTKYPLYGFTNSKEIIKAFKETRNNSKFIYLKDDMSKEDYVNFFNNNANKEINYNVFMHYKGSYVYEVQVPSVWHEREQVSDYIDSGLMYTLDFGSYKYNKNLLKLKIKYLDDLFRIGFLDSWKLCMVKDNVDMDPIYSGYDLNDYDKVSEYMGEPDVFLRTSVNELNIFIYFYSDLLVR